MFLYLLNPGCWTSGWPQSSLAEFTGVSQWYLLVLDPLLLTLHFLTELRMNTHGIMVETTEVFNNSNVFQNKILKNGRLS